MHESIFKGDDILNLTYKMYKCDLKENKNEHLNMAKGKWIQRLFDACSQVTLCFLTRTQNLRLKEEIYLTEIIKFILWSEIVYCMNSI